MIATIRSMRKLTKDCRMQADSLHEIRKGLDRLAFELGDERVGNRPVSEGHVINAAILILMGMDPAERRRAAKAAFDRMNYLLTLDEPEPQPHESDNPPGEAGGLERAVTIEDPKGRSVRPRKGNGKGKNAG
jgi:hypothetical protein